MRKSVGALIALITFLAFFVAMMPAAFVYNFFQDKISRVIPDVNFNSFEGTVWSGKSYVQIKHFPIVTCTWKISPLALFKAHIESSLSFSSNGLTGSADISVSNKGADIDNLSAVARSNYLNQFTIPYGLDLSGNIQLSNANLSFDNEWLTDSEGELTWQGGIVHIQPPQQIHTASLPPLKGQIYQQERTLRLDVRGAELDLMSVQIKPDGWAIVAINYALLDLTDIPLLADTTERREKPQRENPAVVLEEKIL